jgi:hypothetical protein
MTEEKEDKSYDLEDRLIDFAVRIIRMAESLPKTRVGNHIAGQLIRCGTSPAPNPCSQLWGSPKCRIES